MFDTLIALVTQKTVAVTVGIVLASGAAVGTFASQDAIPIFNDDPPAAADVGAPVVDDDVDDAAEDADEAIAANASDDCTATPAATGTPEATETPDAGETPDADDLDDDADDDDCDDAADDAVCVEVDDDANDTHLDEDTDDGVENDDTHLDEDCDDADDDDDADIHGIPDANPSYEPNDDEDCEKGETEINTTPSGTEVSVPCHAADGGGSGDSGPDDADGEDVDD